MKQLIFYVLVSFGTVLVVNSCMKDHLTDKVQPSQDKMKSAIWNLMIPVNYDNIRSDKLTPRDSTGLQYFPSLETVMMIVSEMQSADSTYDFVEELYNNFGLPIWNFSIQKGEDSSSFIVSIPFDKNLSDSTITGILKYYHGSQASEFRFFARVELDSIIRNVIDSSTTTDYFRGVFFDLLLFEYNLCDKTNLEYIGLLPDSLVTDEELILPRSEYICIDKVWTVYDIIFYSSPSEDPSFAAAQSWFILLGSSIAVTVTEYTNPRQNWTSDCCLIGCPSNIPGMGSGWVSWGQYMNWFTYRKIKVGISLHGTTESRVYHVIAYMGEQLNH